MQTNIDHQGEGQGQTEGYFKVTVCAIISNSSPVTGSII